MLTSNKQRQFTSPGDQVVFTCRVSGSASLEWRSPLITERTTYTATSLPPDTLDRGPFTISLTGVSGENTPLHANLTSTLRVTASQMFMRNEANVMCLSTTANKTDTFAVGGMFYMFL